MSAENAAPDLRAVGRDSSITMLRHTVAMALSLANSVLLSRALGPEGKGLFSIALLLPSTVATLLNLGIAPATIYHVARRTFPPQTAARRNVGIAIGLSALGMGLAGLVAALAGERLFPGVPTVYLYVSLLYVPSTLLSLFLLAVIQGLQDFAAFNRVAIGSQLAGLVLTASLVWGLRTGVNGALIALSVGQLIGALVAWKVLRRHTAGGALEVSRRGYIQELLTYGLKAHLANVLQFLNSHVDLFLINLYLPPAEAGIFTLARALGERMSVIASSASAVVLPRVSELEGAELARQQITTTVTRHVLAVTVVLGLAATVAAQLLVSPIYGSGFQRAAGVFGVFLPGVIMLSAERILASDISGRGRPQVIGRINGVQIVANVLLNLALIPRYGIIGAAIAASASTTLSTLLMIGYYTRNYHVAWKSLLLLDRQDALRLKRVARTQAGKLISRAMRGQRP